MRGLRLRAALRSATFLAASVVAAAARPAGAAPDLTLGMIHTSTPYVSSIGLYRFGIVNLGGGPSVGAITVVDTLPAGLSFFDGVGNQGWTVTAADSIVTATFTGTVAAGDSTAFLIEVNVLPPAYPQVFDRATLSGGGDITPENDVTADLMPVSGPADFSIAMSSSTPFIVGFPGWFYVYAVNHGPLATIGALTVTDTLPAGLTFVSAAGTGWVTAGDGQVVTATYAGPVASGASVGFALQVVVAPGAIPSVTNAASISGWADIDATNNFVSDVVDVQEPVARLGLAKHHVGTFVAGLEGTYAFSVTNQGLAPTTAVYAV
ncbi:MAG TPA: hypothetical protein VKP11_09380, partial [Frankiaceae bacterium]|nr:hypothetical protein [Frankiaceae bacterium]